jgi:hypothetical protein
MANALKILKKMRNNPRDWRIEDLKIVANHYGIDHVQPGTSQVTFRHPKAGRLSVPADIPIKAVYVKLFVRLVDATSEEEE